MGNLLQSPEFVAFLIGGAVASLAWLIRLESKVFFQGKQMEILEKKVDAEIAKLEKRIDLGESKHDNLDEKFNAIWKELSVISKSIVRIEAWHESRTEKD